MAKTLEFTYNEEVYTLEYTRRTVSEMEKNGFVVSDIDKKPMTILPMLFEGAFLAHHRNTKKDTINAIYASLSNKEGLIAKLAEMYNEPIMTLIAEPEDDEGKVDWTASW